MEQFSSNKFTPMFNLYFTKVVIYNFNKILINRISQQVK